MSGDRSGKLPGSDMMSSTMEVDGSDRADDAIRAGLPIEPLAGGDGDEVVMEEGGIDADDDNTISAASST